MLLKAMGVADETIPRLFMRGNPMAFLKGVCEGCDEILKQNPINFRNKIQT